MPGINLAIIYLQEELRNIIAKYAWIIKWLDIIQTTTNHWRLCSCVIDAINYCIINYIKKQMSRVLITGGTGALGSQIKEIGEHTIFKTSVADMDITDKVMVKEVVGWWKPEVIIHLASMIGEECETNIEQAHRVNVDGTMNLMRFGQENGMRRFIFTSSSAVYTQTKMYPTKENENIKPMNTYGATKLEAEQLLSRENKGELIILRPFNIYGTNFSRSIINRMLTSEKIVLVNPNNYYRDYVHCSDVIKVIKLAVDVEMKEKEYIVNIGSGITRTTMGLVHYMNACGIYPNYEVQKRKGSSISWANITKLQELFNYKPITDIIFYNDKHVSI